MIESRSPQNMTDLVAQAEETTEQEVLLLAQRARKAQVQWARSGANARAQALSGIADALDGERAGLADLIVREVGKPTVEAAGEVARAVAILRYYAQQVFDPMGSMHEPSANGLLFSRRRPHGLVGLITPWNFPLAIPIWKIAPALAFGNAVLIKPSPEAIGVAQMLQTLAARVLPDGLMATAPGGVETACAVIDQSDAVSFTGSTVGGRSVVSRAAAAGKPVQAEMGGSNAAILLPDADLGAAAQDIVQAAMHFAGQKCTATQRVLVMGDAAAFEDEVLRAAGRLVVGDPAVHGTQVGPVINAHSQQMVQRTLDEALELGGRLVHRSRGTDGQNDLFVSPTVIADVPRHAALATSEVFGPVLELRAVAGVEQALSEVNDLPQGLVTTVHTASLRSALDLSAALQVGMVKVNAPSTGVDFYLPFGGTKESGYGTPEQGKAAHAFYTVNQTVTLAPGRDVGA